MKRVVLKEMHLMNFGLFEDFHVEFSNPKNVIAGANGTGKTTIADAFSWVFTDKLFNGNTAEVRPHDEQGNALTNADIIVTVYVDIDGEDYIFEKLSHRGIKGNETQYSINGNQMTSKIYKEAICDLFGVTQEQFGFCFSAEHFLKCDTATRRTVLFNMVDIDGDYKLAEDSEQFKELAGLFAENVSSINSLVKEYKLKLNGKGKIDKGLYGQLDDINSRIAELTNIPLPKSGAVAKYVRERIADLCCRSTEVAMQIIEFEKWIDMLKQFAKYKTDVYAARINELFGTAEFVFSEPTMSGEPRDICDLRYKGERYGKRLNTGARVMMECDIVKAFQKVYGLNLPLFVDNAESLTMSSVYAIVHDIEGQYIALMAEDCELIIEK